MKGRMKFMLPKKKTGCNQIGNIYLLKGITLKEKSILTRRERDRGIAAGRELVWKKS